jgi:hypothetical protein
VEQNKTSVSEELKERAISLGLCKEWTGEWQKEDLDSLCEKYARGIDFCIDHDYPTTEYMKAHFDGVMQKHGIYVNDVFDEKNARKIIINGISVGHLLYDSYSVGKIYLRHSSQLKLDVEDNSKVFIFVYDDSFVEINNGENSKVYVYKYGGEVKANNKNITIHEL